MKKPGEIKKAEPTDAVFGFFSMEGAASGINLFVVYCQPKRSCTDFKRHQTVAKKTTKRKTVSSTTPAKRKQRPMIVQKVADYLSTLTPMQLNQHALPTLQDMALQDPVKDWCKSPEEAASRIHKELFIEGGPLRHQYEALVHVLSMRSLVREDVAALSHATAQTAARSAFLRWAMELD